MVPGVPFSLGPKNEKEILDQITLNRFQRVANRVVQVLIAEGFTLKDTLQFADFFKGGMYNARNDSAEFKECTKIELALLNKKLDEIVKK